MSAAMNKYFVPGFGISRSVIQHEIKYHCGPHAIARPYIHQGRDGFLITTPGPPLTEAQVRDLKTSSRRYEEQQASKGSSGPEPVFLNQPVAVNKGDRSSRR